MTLNIPLHIRENAGIMRHLEPVTMGIPIPKGKVTNQKLRLTDPNKEAIPLQTEIMAVWPDKSIQWLLLDFQVSCNAYETKTLMLSFVALENSEHQPQKFLSFEELENQILVNSGTISFFISTQTFKPFDQVSSNEKNKIIAEESETVLTDENGFKCTNVITNLCWETKKDLRSTLRIEGSFMTAAGIQYATYIARLNFYAGKSFCKIDFTLCNPQSAKHPGGLWDLGDPGSIYFNDLSMSVFANTDTDQAAGTCCLAGDIAKREQSQEIREEVSLKKSLIIYQDSSGGEQWRSLNHVNQNNEVKTSFQGFKIFAGGNPIKDGHRASPYAILRSKEKSISIGLQYFWQNFPKALEITSEKITVRLFPYHFNDCFELQGGEQKTHTIYINCNQKNESEESALEWIHHPLVSGVPSSWSVSSEAIPYLVSDSDLADCRLTKIVHAAVNGPDNFFSRREIIDEYGWRHFGEWYADHEAVGYKGKFPLISHYNNQYDAIYGALCQYLSSQNYDWFLLADQLCRHVRDIDIYHTENDRPEYNHGLFWHTEHYIDAKTATHRSFSKQHADQRTLAGYGGGPSLAHNYSSGFMLHYFITGETSSQEAALKLSNNVLATIAIDKTVTSKIVNTLKKNKQRLQERVKSKNFVNLMKVYGLDGPGRGAGNALNTLLNGFSLSKNQKYFETAEKLIRDCIHSTDDICKMDMSDVENRWMYTIFLQSLGKYLDLKNQISAKNDEMWHYAQKSLAHYADWMCKNEYLYLEKPDILEYPNETWAAQEIRKCNVFLYAAKHTLEDDKRQIFIKKAHVFYEGCLDQLDKFEGQKLTRIIAILLQNCMMYSFFRKIGMTDSTASISKINEYNSKRVMKNGCSIFKTSFSFKMLSPKNELSYIKWRMKDMMNK